jgi:Spy/CpxP family protein refolding chaperone
MRSSIILLSILLTGATASAQIERQPVVVKADSAQAANPNNKADKMSRKDRFKDLDLTREQRAKLKEINQSGKAAREAIENNTGLSEEEKKKQLRNHQREQMQKIQAILTPEQREKFKASRQNNS